MMRTTFFVLSLLVGLPYASQGQIQMLFTTDPGANIRSPLDIDSLFYWYAADVGVTTDNNKVTQWNDLSGNGHHVTQADTSKAPTLEATGGPNSRPTMTFDGTDDFMASAAHFWGSDDITVIVVMKFATNDNAQQATDFVLTKRGSTERVWEYLGADSLFITARKSGLFQTFKDGGTTNFIEVKTPINFKHTSWRVQAISSNGAGTYSWVQDGSSVSITRTVKGTGDDTIINVSGPLFVGSLSSLAGSNMLKGSISEIIVYSRALTTAERENLEKNYLCKKYGLACP